MHYKAILLDADGTIMDFEAAEENALRGLLADLGMADPEAADVYSRYNSECWAMLERGELTPAELELRRFARFLGHYGRRDDVRAVSDAYLDLLSRQSIPLEGALEAVRELSGMAALAVVTNGISRVQHGRLDPLPVRACLGPLIVSGEVGYAKPDPRLIHCALAALGVAAGEALMVGDSLSSDIRAANAAGVDACWINPEQRPCPPDRRVRYEIAHIRELPALLRGLSAAEEEHS